MRMRPPAQLRDLARPSRRADSGRARPRRRRRRTSASGASIRSRASTSRCASGSSSSSTSGSRSRHAARPTSLRWPPESTRVGFARSSSSRPTSTSSARARPSNPGPPAAVQRSISSSWRLSSFGQAVEIAARFAELRLDRLQLVLRARRGRDARRATSRARGARRPRSAAAGTRRRVPRRAVTSPASGCSSPARIRMSVDLPPPFGPIMPRRTPASMSKSSPPRISREPKLLAMPRACRSAMEPA